MINTCPFEQLVRRDSSRLFSVHYDNYFNCAR
jgi:hypothetical protein